LIGLVGHELGGFPRQISGVVAVMKPLIRGWAVTGGAGQLFGRGAIDAFLRAVGTRGSQIKTAAFAGPVGIAFRP